MNRCVDRVPPSASRSTYSAPGSCQPFLIEPPIRASRPLPHRRPELRCNGFLIHTPSRTLVSAIRKRSGGGANRPPTGGGAAPRTATVHRGGGVGAAGPARPPQAPG